jgi:acetyltransferase-like isoleucine patch superfamily enzyme
MKNFFINFFGSFLSVLHKVFVRYSSAKIEKYLGKTGKNCYIAYPYNIKGMKNIFINDGVKIGDGATIYSTKAKVIIGKNSFSGPNLTIITGDHPYSPGSYMSDIRKKENQKGFDEDVIIDEDVWIGSNVVILKGVKIGRCAIIAAGSIVVKDVPSYSIVAGNPSRILKFKWDIDDILLHEAYLYPNNKEKRMTFLQIQTLLNKHIKNTKNSNL